MSTKTNTKTASATPEVRAWHSNEGELGKALLTAQDTVGKLIAQLEKVEQQRDELLAALKRVTERLQTATEWIEDRVRNDGEETPDAIVDNRYDIENAYSAMRAAIARAEGK